MQVTVDLTKAWAAEGTTVAEALLSVIADRVTAGYEEQLRKAALAALASAVDQHVEAAVAEALLATLGKQFPRVNRFGEVVGTTSLRERVVEELETAVHALSHADFDSSRRGEGYRKMIRETVAEVVRGEVARELDSIRAETRAQFRKALEQTLDRKA